MSKKTALERLLRPKTVAVFGGDSAAAVVRQCEAIGFDGEIWAVNPHRTEMAGIACVAELDELPGVPDASFVAAPPAISLEIIRELSAKGAPGAVCFASGFAETGEQGAELEQRLREAAGDMAVIGPNCHGYLNYLDGVALWPDEHGGQRTGQGVAIITQSGNIGINLTMQRRGLDVAYVISIGNNSMLHMHEYIDTLLSDSRVTAIGLYIEGLQDVSGFSGAAIRAMQKGVPIVALKAGRSSRGAEITMSHTGSLAGSDKLYSALFARLGIARCNTVSQFLETLKFLSIVGPLPDNSISSMSCSGGEAAIVADNAELLGLPTPKFRDDSIDKLQALLGPNVDVANPLDYHLYVWGDFDKLTASYAEVLSNEFACTLLILDYPPGDDNDDENWQIAERALLAAVAKTGQRAVIVSSLPETMPGIVRDRLKAAGITPMQGIEDCLFAIRAAAEIGAAQRNVANILSVAESASVTGDATMLDEWDSKQALARSGVSIPDGKTCGQQETVTIANALGYPVVLKALSAQLAHKSEAGAVAVDLRDAVAVQEATDRMAADFDRFLLEQMVGPAIAELIVGVSRDETFGLTLLIGTGGTLVELFDDTVSLLLPVQRSEIEAAILSLKAGALIGAFRGGPAGNLKAAIDAIEAIVRYAEANSDTLMELDVNPLIVTPDDAVAADALIRVATSDHK